MILKNKGMYLETIINNSIQKILEKNIALIQKMPINTNVISIENNIVKSKLNKNFFCDYIGIWQGMYLEFEAKETELEYFNLNNIKKNQLEKLVKVNENNGISFVIIYFHKFEKFFCLTISEILNLKNKKIPFHFFCENFKEIKQNGIFIEFEDIFSHLINYTL